jgi:hypothetical protein
MGDMTSRSELLKEEGEYRSYFKTQFPLRTAAIYSRGVVGSKFVLDVALATPAAILNLKPCESKYRSFSRRKQF